MPRLTPDQRNYYYLQEDEKSAIHKAILPVLYQDRSSPSLADGETGLAIVAANSINDLETEFRKLPQPNLAYLERSPAAIASDIVEYYFGLPHQRDALLKKLVIWRLLDTRESALAKLSERLASVFSPANSPNMVDAIVPIATSWYRPPAVIGAPYSRYIVGDALDFN